MLPLAVGPAVLAVAWLGLVRSDHGGILPVIGCITLPLGLLYFRAHAHEVYFWETNVAVLGASFCLFAGGHLLARGVHRGVRLAAAMALGMVAVATVGKANNWSASFLPLVEWLALLFFVAMGITLAIHLAALAALARIADGRARP